MSMLPDLETSQELKHIVRRNLECLGIVVIEWPQARGSRSFPDKPLQVFETERSFVIVVNLARKILDLQR